MSFAKGLLVDNHTQLGGRCKKLLLGWAAILVLAWNKFLEIKIGFRELITFLTQLYGSFKASRSDYHNLVCSHKETCAIIMHTFETLT